MARKFALLSFAVLIFKLNQSKKILKDACMIIIYVVTKTRTTDHHIKKMVDSMSQKKRRGV